MPDGVNSNRVVGLIGEAHAIVADSQPQLARLSLELLRGGKRGNCEKRRKSFVINILSSKFFEIRILQGNSR